MAWTPTHLVPSAGLDERATPDPDAAVTGRLRPELEVAVVDQRGAWARVIRADGASGWVDARLLVSYERPADQIDYARAFAIAAERGPIHLAESAPVANRVRAVVVAIAGGAGLCVSALLPWIRSGGRSVNAFDVPVEFLLAHDSPARLGLQVGLVVFALGVAGGLFALATPAGPGRKVAGMAAVVVTSLFMLQLQQQLAATSATGRPSLLGTVGLGVYLALAGGLALAFAPRRSGR